MQASTEIEREVRTFLVQNFPLYEEAKVDRDDSLVETGVIDSLGILELVDFVETRFELRIPEDELLPENLDSIGNITRYLAQKLGDGTVARNDAGGS